MDCRFCISDYPEDYVERSGETIYSDSYTDVEIDLVSKELEFVYRDDEHTLYHESYFKIKYCPMCGRKL